MGLQQYYLAQSPRYAGSAEGPKKQLCLVARGMKKVGSTKSHQDKGKHPESPARQEGRQILRVRNQ
jgi:hypothetical protein